VPLLHSPTGRREFSSPRLPFAFEERFFCLFKWQCTQITVDLDENKKKSFWQHPSGIFVVLSQHLFSVKLLDVAGVGGGGVVAEALVIARKVFHASVRVKQL